MKSRLEFKFPTPYEWWSNSLPAGQEKASNALGMSGGRGGVLKLRFDWYISRTIGFEPSKNKIGTIRMNGIAICLCARMCCIHVHVLTDIVIACHSTFEMQAQDCNEQSPCILAATLGVTKPVFVLLLMFLSLISLKLYSVFSFFVILFPATYMY